MKTRTAKRGIYIGAAAGLLAFALGGLLHGAFIGGVLGLNIAGSLFGLPLTSAIMPRLIVGAMMVLGIVISGVLLVTGGSLLGCVAGAALENLLHRRPAEAATQAK